MAMLWFSLSSWIHIPPKIKSHWHIDAILAPLVCLWIITQDALNLWKKSKQFKWVYAVAFYLFLYFCYSENLWRTTAIISSSNSMNMCVWYVIM